MISKYVRIYQIYGGFWLLLETVVNYTTKKESKFEKFKEVVLDFLKSRFGIDVICLVAIIIDLYVTSQLTIFLRLLLFIKVPDFFDKVEKL